MNQTRNRNCCKCYDSVVVDVSKVNEDGTCRTCGKDLPFAIVVIEEIIVNSREDVDRLNREEHAQRANAL